MHLIENIGHMHVFVTELKCCQSDETLANQRETILVDLITLGTLLRLVKQIRGMNHCLDEELFVMESISNVILELI